MIASENSPLRNSPRVLSAKRFDRVEKMKRTGKLSLGFCIAMLTIALAAPHLSSPKLALRFLPKDVYEAGKDHPAPSLPKRLLGHLLLVITAAYAVWAYRDISDGIRLESVFQKGDGCEDRTDAYRVQKKKPLNHMTERTRSKIIRGK